MRNHDTFRGLTQGFRGWALATSRGMSSGGGYDGETFQSIDLHYVPDGEVADAHIVFEADVGPDGQPVIRVRLPDVLRVVVPSTAVATSPACSPIDAAHDPSTVIMPMRDESGDLKRPDAICEGCGAVGTMSKIARQDSTGRDLEVHRFCADCWPEQNARYEARMKYRARRIRERAFANESTAPSDDEGSWYFAAQSWHAMQDMVEETMLRLHSAPPPGRQQLQAMASWLQSLADHIDDPMPSDVAGFIHQYGGTREVGDG